MNITLEFIFYTPEAYSLYFLFSLGRSPISPPPHPLHFLFSKITIAQYFYNLKQITYTSLLMDHVKKGSSYQYLSIDQYQRMEFSVDVQSYYWCLYCVKGQSTSDFVLHSLMYCSCMMLCTSISSQILTLL